MEDASKGMKTAQSQILQEELTGVKEALGVANDCAGKPTFHYVIPLYHQMRALEFYSGIGAPTQCFINAIPLTGL